MRASALAGFPEVYDAMQIGVLCPNASARPRGVPASQQRHIAGGVDTCPSGAHCVFADAATGSDASGDGSASKPFASVARLSPAPAAAL